MQLYALITFKKAHRIKGFMISQIVQTVTAKANFRFLVLKLISLAGSKILLTSISL
jgi:hypothetical protein